MFKKLSNNLSIKNIVIILLTIIFTVIPFYNIVIKGVYHWHITQPEFWQGGLEILIFIFFSFILSHKCESKMNTILLLFGAIYLSMNGVIIPFMTVYIYFEILHYIGFTILNIKKGECINRIIENFIAGISVWGVFAIICSLLKIGTFNDLRIMTLALLIICIILNNKKKYYSLFNYFNDFINKNNKNSLSKISIIVLTFLVLALIAKTNTTQDYDSLWYGLRPEHVLIGSHSFYDYLGYSAFVYYYPKLMELLFLPISNLGDYSFIIIGNVFVYILLIVCLYRIFNNMFKNINKDANYKFNLITWIILVIATIPAITGITDSAKPDILGCFLTICAFMFFTEFLSDKKKNEFLILAIVSLILATGTKLTYILWGGLLFFVIIYILILLIYKKEISLSDFKFKKFKNVYLVTFSSIFFILGIHYRTLKLTGYPLYPSFLNVFNVFGFNPIYPAKNVSINLTELSLQGPGYIINRLYELFFNPNSLPHVIMLWVSSIIPFMLIVSILYYRKSTCKKNIFIILLTIAYIISTFYYMVFQEIPDGNYFIAPIIILLLILINKVYISQEVQLNKINDKTIRFMIIMFIFLQTPIMFVSSPSWQIGTKPFSKDIVKTNFETNIVNESSYKQNGYYNIAKYISTNMSKERIIASTIDLTILNRIDGPIEAFGQIQDPHLSNKDITANYENFYKYLNQSKIRGFLLLNEDNSVFREYVEKYIKQNGYSNMIKDEKGVFYIINAQDYSSPVRIDSDNIWDDGWLPKESNFKMTTGENGLLSILGYYPFKIEESLTGTIYINNISNKFKISEGQFKLEFPVPKNDIITVKIQCDFDRQASGQDSRRVSFVLNRLEGK